MIYGHRLNHIVISIIFFLIFGFFCRSAFAISPLPGSVEPGSVTKNYLPSLPTGPSAVPKLTRPEEKPSGLGAEAEKIKFKLNGIILEGNHVYTTQQLLPLYKDKLGKVITIAELQNIVQSITNF